MAALRLRDRDAIVTGEGLIFRVLGYSHPPGASICDAEYAPATVFKSDNPKAFRNKGQHVFYKFYGDEGWKFIRDSFPQYVVLHEMLGKRVVGVGHSDIREVRRPEVRLEELVKAEPEDDLLEAVHRVLEFATQYSGLSLENFGVFGSLLHGFYSPKFSDIDLIVYGRRNLARLCETLQEMYKTGFPQLRNEFATDEPIRGKNWRFRNFSEEEYLRHQRRKLIYALFVDEKKGSTTKTEFEPVREWSEIGREYDSELSIRQCGWTRVLARITEDADAAFIPSVYGIEPLETLGRTREALEAVRIVSYMEEFRLQARRDETVYVEGNLEQVEIPKDSFYQIALTYCPRYYEQVLRVSA